MFVCGFAVRDATEQRDGCLVCWGLLKVILNSPTLNKRRKWMRFFFFSRSGHLRANVDGRGREATWLACLSPVLGSLH